jgi:mono/diheme cytochrome c family protein
MSRPYVSLPGAAALVVAGGLLACGSEEQLKPIAQPLKLAGNKTVSVEQLERGQEQYTLYCRPCHGVAGNGRGPAGIGLRPPPRNFTEPVFKFGGVEAGSLPPDAELHRIIKGGLKGTAMLPWDVPDAIVDDIIQYIKTFSDVWKEDEPAKPIEITNDPWKGKEAEGIARGKIVYHGLAQCLKCHPAYLTKAEIFEAEKVATGNGTGAFRESPYEPEAKFADAFKHTLLPPDFMRHDVKSGSTPRDIFRTVASGIGGTAMPAWKGSIPDEDIWAIAHFVSSLVDMRGTPAVAEFQKKMAQQPPFTPPAAEPAPEAAPAEEKKDEKKK